MPIYEYKCRVCDEHVEVEQSFTDDTLTEIDGCTVDESGSHQVKKVFAAPAIAFKGDGFYRNDARTSSGASSKTSSDSSVAASASDSDSSKSDSSASTSSSNSSTESSPTKTSSGDKATSSSSAASG